VKFLTPISLEEAQEAKLELICGKLKLKPDIRVLYVGCGWGSLAKFAAEKYHVKVVGIVYIGNVRQNRKIGN